MAQHSLHRTSGIDAPADPCRGRHGVLSTAAALLASLTLVCTSCVRPTPRPTHPNSKPVDLARLWQEPRDLQSRDLFNGPGGEALAPSANAPYVFVEEDRSGYSHGYEVRGPKGLTWRVKLGPEAQPEVVTSRVLWAIGYHQPPTYYLPSWTLVGTVAGPQPAGRFRPDLTDRQVVDEWSWYENEFVATRPFKALLVASLVLNSWDWKTSNNKIYQVDDPNGGSQRLYVVRDLGASLGKTTFPPFFKWLPVRGLGQGTRNDLEGFEAQHLVRRVKGERVEFDYRGIHRPLVDSLSVDDVVWTCQLMSRISDSQWHDAFSAAGYSAVQNRRYVTKIKMKISEGLSLNQH